MIRKRRAAALITACIITVFFSIVGIAFTIRSIQEKNLANRYINSVRAFWLAEAGIAKGLKNLSASSVNNCLDCPQASSCCYAATIQPYGEAGTDYQIDSNGSVTLSSGAVITKGVSVVVRGQPSGFDYAIGTTGALVLRGNAYTITGMVGENTTIDFSGLFGESKDAIKLRARNHYDDELVSPVDEITWVDVSSEEELTVSGNLEGSGILIISGDVHFSGSFIFDGIIYIAGKLTISGTPVINGSILAEGGTDIDTTISGHVTIAHDPDVISNVLEYTPQATYSGPPEIISWRQTN